MNRPLVSILAAGSTFLACERTASKPQAPEAPQPAAQIQFQTREECQRAAELSRQGTLNSLLLIGAQPSQIRYDATEVELRYKKLCAGLPPANDKIEAAQNHGGRPSIEALRATKGNDL